MVAITIDLLLIIFSSAIFGIQIAEDSLLALKVKNMLGLVQPYPIHLKTLGKFSAWKKMIGTAFYLVLPLIFVLVILFRLHALFSELLDCKYCTTYHISWLLLYLTQGFSLMYSLLYGTLGILAVYIIERIRK